PDAGGRAGGDPREDRCEGAGRPHRATRGDRRGPRVPRVGGRGVHHGPGPVRGRRDVGRRLSAARRRAAGSQPTKWPVTNTNANTIRSPREQRRSVSPSMPRGPTRPSTAKAGTAARNSRPTLSGAKPTATAMAKEL